MRGLFSLINRNMPRLERPPEEHVYQAYGIYMLESKHRLIRNLKKLYSPSVHGHKTWRSSFLLMDYLREHPIKKGSTVMEIGCGWGPAAVYCAKSFEAKVTGVDMDKDVFPFLSVYAELNNVKVATKVSRFENLTAKRLGREKVIVGADICFWDSLVKPLHKMIGRAFKGGTKRIIIADPGRPTFYELADLCSKKYQTNFCEWYSVEPSRSTGEILEIRPKKKK